MAFRTAVDQFSDWRWRLANLYWITDEEGHRVLFQPNWAQEELFEEMHYLNLVLKARQLGFTTFIQLFMLDAAVFNSNMSCGTIAHKLEDAQAVFRTKIKYPYDSLPAGIRQEVPIIKSNASELLLGNNSQVRVGTSLRSGTLQILHISEYGKICAKFPDKAREVRTGALNTVQAGQLIFIESTAEGQAGHFYDQCQSAQTKLRTGAVLSKLDYKFHFYPWWRAPKYELDPEGVVIDDYYRRYFEELQARHGIVLSDRKRAWYAKKAEDQGEDMKREFPSTPQEAFEASVEGAYYGAQMAKAELQGRIGSFPAVPGFLVHTAWDIGVGDSTAIWFFQIIAGRVRVVGFYGNNGEGMPHYLGELSRLAEERGWSYGRHYLPHDARVKEWGSGKTRMEQLIEAGLIPCIATAASIDDGIEAVRQTLPLCEFDAGPCAEGLKALKAYRKEWDESRGIFLNQPYHDWASDPADAFRYLSLSWRIVPETVEPEPDFVPDVPLITTMSVDRWLASRPVEKRHSRV